MRHGRFAFALLAATLVAGCGAMPAKSESDASDEKDTAEIPLPPGTLSGKDVETLFSGKTVESVTFSDGDVRQAYYAADGELRQLRDDGPRLGTWRVNERGRLCERFDDGRERCRIVVDTGAGFVKYVVKIDGHHRPVVRYLSFRAGNPRGL